MAAIVLASSSQRRIQLLKRENLTFITHPAHVDESLSHKGMPYELAMYLAFKKASSIEKEYRGGEIIIGADTLVVYENRIYGKPVHKEDCFAMLSALSEKTHSVITGVAFLKAGTMDRKAFYEKTEVTFKKIPEDELFNYIETEEPWDKAGGYAIQGTFSKYVENLKGDYDNVMGLPVKRILEELKAF